MLIHYFIRHIRPPIVGQRMQQIFRSKDPAIEVIVIFLYSRYQRIESFTCVLTAQLLVQRAGQARRGTQREVQQGAVLRRDAVVGGSHGSRGRTVCRSGSGCRLR